MSSSEPHLYARLCTTAAIYARAISSTRLESIRETSTTVSCHDTLAAELTRPQVGEYGGVSPRGDTPAARLN